MVLSFIKRNNDTLYLTSNFKFTAEIAVLG